jgi:N-acetylmuramic acid 6-phosphate etherase
MTLPGAPPPAGANSPPGVETPAELGANSPPGVDTPARTSLLPGAARPSDSAPPAELGRLSTEAVRPGLADLDLLGTAELVALMAADSRRATEAVATAATSITTAVDVVCARLAAGGRLVYVGAGTAGRLAVLDAAELGPTFNVPAGTVEAVLAGGEGAVRRSVEGAEDDEAAGAAALEQLSVGEKDVVIGVSASGRTPFVLGAIAHARAAGAATIGVSCNAMSKLSSLAETAIDIEVGGEVIAGSSRLNAGTAQKITLNTLSTAAMVRLGKTYGNLMVDLRATNTKLRDRAVRIVQSITGVGPQAAAQALEAAGWDAKLACLMAASGQDLATVSSALGTAGGRLRPALALVGAGTVHDAPAGGVPAGGAPAGGGEPAGGAMVAPGRPELRDVLVDGRSITPDRA